jgi:hypothetical protein
MLIYGAKLSTSNMTPAYLNGKWQVSFNVEIVFWATSDVTESEPEVVDAIESLWSIS